MRACSPKRPAPPDSIVDIQVGRVGSAEGKPKEKIKTRSRPLEMPLRAGLLLLASPAFGNKAVADPWFGLNVLSARLVFEFFA